jgi:hypothetical protein
VAFVYALLACGRTSQQPNASVVEGGAASDVSGAGAGAAGTRQCEGGEQIEACRVPVWNRCGGFDAPGYCSRIHFCSPPFDDQLPRHNVCDGTADCPNGSDELNCVKGQDYFACDDGARIGLNRVCDQVADCADETDETRCPG